MTTAYPLAWPFGRPRTPSADRTGSAFKQTQEKAQKFLMLELKRLGAEDVIFSTNIPVRRDGLPYAQAEKYAKQDPGVAVYFKRKRGGKMVDTVFACDRWEKMGDNIYAIGKTIEALRGIERWGSGDMMEAAFTGFEALPPPASERPWRDVFHDMGVMVIGNSFEDARGAYLILAKKFHPDNGGSPETMAMLNAAFDRAKAELS